MKQNKKRRAGQSSVPMQLDGSAQWQSARLESRQSGI
jgi:hypothetical protein